MGMVMAKCGNCGGELNVDTERGFCFCSYCGTKFVLRNDVNNYNTTNNYYTNNNVQAENYYGAKEPFANMLNRERLYQQAHDNCRLCELYEAMVNDYPEQYQGWAGKLAVLTGSFSGVKNKRDFSEEERLLEMCRTLAPADAYSSIAAGYSAYKKGCLRLALNDLRSTKTFWEQNYSESAARKTSDQKKMAKDFRRDLRRAGQGTFSAVTSMLFGAALSIAGISAMAKYNPVIGTIAAVFMILPGLAWVRSAVKKLIKIGSCKKEAEKRYEESRGNYSRENESTRARISDLESEISALERELRAA